MNHTVRETEKSLGHTKTISDQQDNFPVTSDISSGHVERNLIKQINPLEPINICTDVLFFV